MTREQADSLMDAFDAANVSARITRRSGRREGEEATYSVSVANFPSSRGFISALNEAGVHDASYSAGSGWKFEFGEAA